MSALPTPPLRPYQDQGVAWLVEKLKLRTVKAVLLADEAGLGKTRQTLEAAQRLGVERVLIICPAGARRVWTAEIQRWAGPFWAGNTVLVEPGGSFLDIKRALTKPGVLILVVGYDELSNLKSHLGAELRRCQWDILVLDECHYLKNLSNRTQQIYGSRGSDTGVQAHADKVVLLTGTPTPNHAGELWHHARTFWPDLVRDRGPRGKVMTQDEFEARFTRYRDTVYGRQITGSKNQQVLRERLKDVILRRRKDDVLPELPPLIVQDVPLIWQRPQFDWDVDAAAARIAPTANITDDELLRLLRLPNPLTTTLRRQTGEMKVRPTILWVQERMASASKLLLFAWHHSVIEHLRRGLLEFGPVVVTGETSPLARAMAIEAFQTRPQTRVFIGQILAAGTAITLTAASEVAIVEPSWTPGENVQAICRAHRLGQRDSVLASFLYLPGTLDERIMQVFRRKAAEISELQGDDNASAA